MMRMRSILLAGLWAALVSPPTVAEETAPVAQPALPSLPPMRPAHLPPKLIIGPVTATLTASAIQATSAPGTRAFVQIKMFSDSRRRGGDEIGLQLQPEHGEIVGVRGARVISQDDSGSRLLRVDGLRRNRIQTVLIEVLLKATGNGEANQLRVTFTREAGEDGGTVPQPIVLKWPMSDCGESYHAALGEIGAQGGNELRDLWRSVASRDRSVSRRWMFRPSVPRRRRGRGDELVTKSTTRAQARAIYGETNRLMRAGYDRTLRRRGRHGWMLTKTSYDLKRYFSQSMNPALCTGAPGFAAYYEDQLEPLAERHDRLVRLSRQADRLARDKAETVFAATTGLPGGHPAWGGATLVVLQAPSTEREDRKALLVSLLQATRFPPALVSQLREAPNAYRALRTLDEVGIKTDRLPDEVYDRLRDAVGAIEAAVRLADFKARYERFWTGFNGSLQAIRKAHAEHCVCGS